jgi:glycosyltransferase involved in cell wall biosynthesis
MTQPLVSVALCTYNGAEYLQDQLLSILNQTYPSLELVIVDDRSTDTTLEIVEELARKDARIRVYKNEENLGHNLNFSKACSLCNGAFIAIADQDDVWELTKLERMMEQILQNPETILVHCKSARFGSHRNHPSIKSTRLIKYLDGNDPRKLLLFNHINGHNMLFRKSLLEAALPFPKNVYYDWWIAVMACCYGQLKHVNEILVWHRVHETNATGAAKPVVPFYLQTKTNLRQLATIHALPEQAKNLIKNLLTEYEKMPGIRFSFRLFILIMRHAPILFSHKKRIFPWFSYIKFAFRSAHSNTKA